MISETTVAVVGAGQAGLSVSYCLGQRSIGHAVLEKHRVGHAWRNERWDNFCLVTPNRQCRLPGYAYAGKDPHGFMLKDQIVDYLEGYAKTFQPPLYEGVSVEAVRANPRGSGFELVTSLGRVLAREVVIATGGYHTPRIPKYASGLPSSVFQVHSAHYKNPAELPPGDVLVVGTGQSGAQIAEDLFLAGRRVHLCVGNAPRCARFYRGRDVVDWLEDMGHYDVPITEQRDPNQVREKTNHYVTGRDGGRDLDLRRFAREGMRLYGPLSDIAGSFLRFEPRLREYLDAADAVYNGINRAIDEHIARQGIEAPPGGVYTPVWRPESEPERLDWQAAGIRSIVWCTGFSADYSYIDFPVFDPSGHPRHERGLTAVEGLYFIGLPWLHTWGSGRFASVGRDAQHIVDVIARRR